MQFFYDGQIRRYITQTIRGFSNFVVKYGDGTLHRIPVMYGDPDRAVASIIRNNSENKAMSVPRISIYVKQLSLDRDRTSDATFVSKMHFRERDIDTTGQSYTHGQGRNYTVERLMPTPFKLDFTVDIWTSSTEQKLQVLEQILVLFNPSLELQTTDNYIDWTSLTVLNLNGITWDSKTVPVGNDTPLSVSSLSLETPIWISPPVKVKHLGVITKIITSLWGATDTSPVGYIEGLGEDLAGPTGTPGYSDLLAQEITTITDYTLQVYNSQAIILSPTEGYIPREPTLDIPVRQGQPIDWYNAINLYPGKFTAGSSRLYLVQSNGAEVVGTVAINPADSTLLLVTWDPDTLVTNTGIDSNGIFDYQVGYTAPAYRNGQTGSQGSPGTFDAIINPQTFVPPTAVAGTRYLIIEDIGSTANLVDSQWTTSNGITITMSGASINGTTLTINGLISGQIQVGMYLSGTNVLPGTRITDGNARTWTVSKTHGYGGGTGSQTITGSFVGQPATNYATAWGPLVAKANDIIEYTGTQWNVIFAHAQETTTMVWQTNIYTGVQYKWNGISWVKSFEGEYTPGSWRLEL